MNRKLNRALNKPALSSCFNEQARPGEGVWDEKHGEGALHIARSKVDIPNT